MHMYRYIFISTFSFAFFNSNWPFSWYILSKQKEDVSKSFQKSLLSLHFLSISTVILWVSGVLLGPSSQCTGLFAQIIRSLYIDSG